MTRTLRSALMLATLALSSFSAEVSLRPEAPSVAFAEKIYRGSSATVSLNKPADLLSLNPSCDLDLTLFAVLGRAVLESFSKGLMPDEFTLHRELSSFSWNSEDVLQLYQAGISNNVLRVFATIKPLGLSADGQNRLIQAGVSQNTVTLLAASADSVAPPPMRRIMDAIFESNPALQNPMIKAQLAAAEPKMLESFRSKEIQKAIWEQLLEAWRSQVHSNQDSRIVIAAAPTEIVDGVGEINMGLMGMLSGGQAINSVFLHSNRLAAALDAAKILNVLNVKTSVEVRLKDLTTLEILAQADAKSFLLRKPASEVSLIRLQEGTEGPSAQFTKGMFFGRKFKSVAEPIPVDSSKTGDFWVMTPKQPLEVGHYAFIASGKNLVLSAFKVH